MTLNNFILNLVFVYWKAYHPMAREQETVTEYQEDKTVIKKLLVKYVSNAVG